MSSANCATNGLALLNHVDIFVGLSFVGASAHNVERTEHPWQSYQCVLHDTQYPYITTLEKSLFWDSIMQARD